MIYGMSVVLHYNADNFHIDFNHDINSYLHLNQPQEPNFIQSPFFQFRHCRYHYRLHLLKYLCFSPQFHFLEVLHQFDQELYCFADQISLLLP